MGHADVRTTQIYAKIVDSKKIEAVNMVDKMFEKMESDQLFLIVAMNIEIAAISRKKRSYFFRLYCKLRIEIHNISSKLRKKIRSLLY